MSASLATRFQAMFEQSAERILVPAVALTVSERDQRAVSNRVIRKLGVLDSRRHLVGMYDAVLDEGSAKRASLAWIWLVVMGYSLSTKELEPECTSPLQPETC